ncbi:MAG: response regulator [Lentisphaeria bacterium]|nr:response regulator [Lentisphaeria bacterium]
MITSTILIVDDDPMIRRTAKLMLERKGFDVLEADSGETACDIFTSSPAPVDLVILDLSMPGMSGEETLGALRKLDGQVKVIIASGYESDLLNQSGEAPDGYLRKPFQMAELYAAVDQQLGCQS